MNILIVTDYFESLGGIEIAVGRLARVLSAAVTRASSTGSRHLNAPSSVTDPFRCRRGTEAGHGIADADPDARQISSVLPVDKADHESLSRRSSGALE